MASVPQQRNNRAAPQKRNPVSPEQYDALKKRVLGNVDRAAAREAAKNKSKPKPSKSEPAPKPKPSKSEPAPSPKPLKSKSGPTAEDIQAQARAHIESHQAYKKVKKSPSAIPPSSELDKRRAQLRAQKDAESKKKTAAKVPKQRGTKQVPKQRGK